MSCWGRWSLLWIAVGLLFVGCSGSAVTIPSASSSTPGPPTVLGRGTVAVIVHKPGSDDKRVWVFPPNSDQYREILIPGSRGDANSLAFDRRQHLYIGINNTAANHYEVLEIDLPAFKVHRDIQVKPSWPHSSVVVDDQNVLYINTKAFVGGDVKMFRRGEREPSLEIKDPLSPLTTLIANSALWIGNEGFPSNALTRYPVYSKDRAWIATIGRSVPIALAVNPESSLVAALVRRNSTRAVDVIDVGSGKRVRTLAEDSNLRAMTSDHSGNVYLAQAAVRADKLYACTFHGCTRTIEMKFKPLAVAVNPLDGNLYVATIGKSAVEVYDPKTFNLVRTIWLQGFDPSVITIEP